MNEQLLEAAVAVQKAWTRAFEARDLTALSGLYAEDTAFYGSTAEFYSTPAGVRTYFEILPLSYKRSDYKVPHVVRLGDNTMAATGEVTFYREESDGTVTELPFRMTHVLVRQGVDWKIATHHASPRPPR